MRALFNEAVALLLGVFGTVLSTLLKDEARGLISKFSRYLVERGVRRLPEEYREEHREAYLASLEFEAQDGKKLSELYAAVEVWLGAGETAKVLEAEAASEKVRHVRVDTTLPRIDSLTQLLSRTVFLERLEGAVRRAKRDSRHEVTLVLFSVDNFKHINNTFGHSRGDELLIAIARRTEKFMSKSATIARYGGDEFVLLLQGRASCKGVTKFIDDLLNHVSSPFELESATHTLSVSAGIALLEDRQDAERLLRNADWAMYQAKIAGKGCYRIFDN